METYVIICPTLDRARYYVDLAYERLKPIVVRSKRRGKFILETADGICLEFVSEYDWYDGPRSKGLCLGRHDVVEMLDVYFEPLLSVWESKYW